MSDKYYGKTTIDEMIIAVMQMVYTDIKTIQNIILFGIN